MLTTSLEFDEGLATAIEKAAQAAGISVIEFITRALHRAVFDAQVDESVARAFDDVQHGRVVDGDAMDRWLGSWGTDHEEGPPASTWETQRDVVRAMTPAQRLQAADRLYWTAREIKEAAIRARHPGWSDEQVKRAVKEAFLFARG